jgi:hypothetical protein
MEANNYGRVMYVPSTGGYLPMIFIYQGKIAVYKISKAVLNTVTRLT